MVVINFVKKGFLIQAPNTLKHKTGRFHVLYDSASA